MKWTIGWIGLSLSVLGLGCSSGAATLQNGRVEITKDDGGMGSLDVLTLAHQIGPNLLNSTFVTEATEPITIAVAPIRNRTGLSFDANLFLRRLRLELNRQAKGKLHFAAQGKSQNDLREHMRVDGKSARIQRLLDETAKEIVSLPELQNGAKFAMLPSQTVNFINLNGESYLTFLRSKIVTESARKCRFLMPGKLEGADYYLSGMFIADSDKTEGMINLADYIRDLEQAEREGKSLFEVIHDESDVEERHTSKHTDEKRTEKKRFVLRSRLSHETMKSEKLRESPKVAKFLNVVLVDTKDKCTIFEKQMNIEEVSSGIGEADYILSAEISDLAKMEAGTRYVLVSVQLINPVANVIVWEDGYEVKFEK